MRKNQGQLHTKKIVTLSDKINYHHKNNAILHERFNANYSISTATIRKVPAISCNVFERPNYQIITLSKMIKIY